MSTLNEYMEETRNTAVYPDATEGTVEAVVYVALGLAGEAGEVANKVKKILRDSDGVLSEETAEKIRAELGDVLWYTARVCDELSFDLDEIAEENIEKLVDRKRRGALKGVGDNR